MVGALGTETADDAAGLIRTTGYFQQTPGRERVRLSYRSTSDLQPAFILN
jgi:hypothetical protein